jgi:hypothetical protein
LGHCTGRYHFFSAASAQFDEYSVDAHHSFIRADRFNEQQAGEARTFREGVHKHAESEVKSPDWNRFGHDACLDSSQEAVDQVCEESGEHSLVVREVELKGARGGV